MDYKIEGFSTTYTTKNKGRCVISGENKTKQISEFTLREVVYI